MMIFFREQLNSRIIAEVPEVELSKSGAPYLSRFGVVRADRETTKLRIVFDGAAESDKEFLSLNKCLEVGTNRMLLLFDTLIRLHSKAIGITADVEKALLQIGINETDRDIVKEMTTHAFDCPRNPALRCDFLLLAFIYICSTSS